ncbi:MAG: restriction endonuclease subunit S [Paludibacteraceae bacterium]|nr:restriction endonuclease subunit S [Paludibacteraceae bacterium]
MQRERTMKDSGIPWIGEIPERWKVVRNKNVFSTSKTFVGEMWNNTQLLSLTTKGIKPVAIGSTSGKVPDSYETYQVVEKDNLVMCLFDLDCSAVFSGLSPICGMISPAYKVLTIKNGYYPDFYAKWFEYIFEGRKFMFLSKNIRYSLTYDEFAALQIVAPPLAEQHLIATFLDKKCSEIDSLIELQEQMIEELKAYKQSVITEAVTKGIRNEELGVRNYKDSGIEWIGDVPEEWEVCRIKNVASLFGRIGFRGYTSDDLNKDGEGAITLSPSNMLPMGMDYTNVTYLSWMKYHESPEIMIQDGDILMVKTGSSYGKVSYVDNLPKEATINPQILRIVAKINSKYLGYYLQTPLFIYQVEGGVVGGTIPTISQEKINNFFVVIPPLAEQQAIADYLDKKCGEIDELITIKQQKIESLKGYKKSVIYEYVTGKREV